MSPELSLGTYWSLQLRPGQTSECCGSFTLFDAIEGVDNLLAEFTAEAPEFPEVQAAGVHARVSLIRFWPV